MQGFYPARLPMRSLCLGNAPQQVSRHLLRDIVGYRGIQKYAPQSIGFVLAE